NLSSNSNRIKPKSQMCTEIPEIREGGVTYPKFKYLYCKSSNNVVSNLSLLTDIDVAVNEIDAPFPPR
ncbi:MAG: hypothetical protein O7D34_09800, partial [Ignavibacteria bacterium]|nr:hypothetical protein [Ignavibacteria bacterium]